MYIPTVSISDSFCDYYYVLFSYTFCSIFVFFFNHFFHPFMFCLFIFRCTYFACPITRNNKNETLYLLWTLRKKQNQKKKKKKFEQTEFVWFNIKLQIIFYSRFRCMDKCIFVELLMAEDEDKTCDVERVRRLLKHTATTNKNMFDLERNTVHWISIQSTYRT